MLGDFEYQVLNGIIAMRKDAYGKTVKQYIETEYKRSVNYGALYATLSRLEDKNYISSEIMAATAVRGGRRKKNYSITGLGQSAFQEKREHALRLGSSDIGGYYA